MGHKFSFFFLLKTGLFSQGFCSNKGNLDISLFVKFLNFDVNKGKDIAENKRETENVDPIVSLLVIIELAESFPMVYRT